MNTKKRIQSQTFQIQTFARCAWTMAMLLIAFCSSRAEELPRPGEAIDAGDSYVLKDGSRVAVYRVVNEVAIKHLRTESIEPIVRQVGIKGEPLATIENGRSNIVDVYYSEDSQAVADLMNVREGVSVYPVLVDPVSWRRMIATDEIIMQFEGGITDSQATALFNQEGFEMVEGPVPSAPAQYLVRMASGEGTDALTRAEQVGGLEGVEWAQPDFLSELEFYAAPNDPLFDKQQYLHNFGQNGALVGADIEAVNAWDITTGHPEVVIAIIDTGVDIDHDDLDWTLGKIFINPGESGSGRETNGIDDDGNGYIDDVNGWDFYGVGDNNPRPGSTRLAAHGTSCAGIAAAQGNNQQGIAGVAYSCKVLPIKIQSDDGGTFASHFSIGRAIRYAADYADVLSSSWGVAGDADAIKSAIDYAATSGRNSRGAAPFFASGNSGSTWLVERFPVNVSSGTYAFSFYYFKTNQTIPERIALDNISLLGADEYTYAEPLFPRVNFETGVIPAGWSVARGGGVTQDWTPATTPIDSFHGTPGTWYLLSPPDSEVPEGGWVELRSPYVALNGQYWLRFARWRYLGTKSGFFVRLLDAQGQVVQTLGSVAPGQALSGGGSHWWVKFPANYANSIAIGAVTDHDLYANYSFYLKVGFQTVTGLFCVGPSNEGWNDVTTLDITGQPGQNDGNDRFQFGGTSSAAPAVAGVAALVLSKNSELTLQQLKDAIRYGCDQVPDGTYVNGQALHYGYGRANAYNSLSITDEDTTAPTVVSVVTKTGRQVEVTFSEKMGSGVTTPANYEIFGTGKGTLASNPSSVRWVGGYTYLLEWTGGEMIAGTGNITIAVWSGAKDVSGNGVGNPFYASSNGSRVVYAISCGPGLPNTTDPIHPFESEKNYWSGAGENRPMGISSVVNGDGTPTAVYKTERSVLTSTFDPGDIVYTLPNITSGINHTVRLYFANSGYSIYPGDVVFAVYINDTLKDYIDLIDEAGGTNIGIWRDYANITANGSGQIVVKIAAINSYNQTWGAWYYNATIGGIKVTAQ